MKHMKVIKYLSMLALVLITATSCMNEFDEPTFDQPPFGNNKIGEANTTIEELKTQYAQIIRSNGYEQITEPKVIEGVVVANDITGNVYKQIVIKDESGAIIIGVNDVGLYAVLPIGQRVRIDCKNLYIGGYGSLAQIGTKYFNTKYSEYQIGRISKLEFQKCVRIIGAPDLKQKELEPLVVDEAFLADKNNKDSAPIYVELRNVNFKEADGTRAYAPESEQISETNTAVERNVLVGKEKVIFRLSTYADFANEAMPTYNFNVRGVLTRYRNPGSNSDSKDYWQFMLTSTADIEKVSE